MRVFVCLYVETVSRSKDYVRSGIRTNLSYACAHLCRRVCLKCRVRVIEDVPLVEFMYLVFTRMPGESYRRRLGSLLLYLCYIFRGLINSLVCWLRTSTDKCWCQQCAAENVWNILNHGSAERRFFSLNHQNQFFVFLFVFVFFF